MDEIVCYDANGYILNHFTQWDVDQMIEIRGADSSSAPQFHFSNSSMKNAIVVQSEVVLGGIRAIVPSLLLQQALPLIVHLYYEEDDDKRPGTRYSVRVPVIPRNKPDNYVYSDTNSGIILDGTDIIVSDTKPAKRPIIWFDVSATVS